MNYYEESETCMLCGIMGQLAHHHLIGGAYRSKSDRLGLVIPLCPRCHEKVHTDAILMRKLRRYAQGLMMDRGWTKERWISEFGKNYMED